MAFTFIFFAQECFAPTPDLCLNYLGDCYKSDCSGLEKSETGKKPARNRVSLPGLGDDAEILIETRFLGWSVV